MDRVTADREIAGKGFVAGIPAEMVVGSCLRFARMVVGSHHLDETAVGVVANRHKVADLMKMNSPHMAYCLCPGWDIDFVEWDHPAPEGDIGS